MGMYYETNSGVVTGEWVTLYLLKFIRILHNLYSSSLTYLGSLDCFLNAFN